MSEEKKEYNTMEEEAISNKETEEILEEDDVNCQKKLFPKKNRKLPLKKRKKRQTKRKDFSEKRKKIKKMKK